VTPPWRIDNLERPNPTTNLTTPWEFHVGWSETTASGTVGYDTTIADDKVTVTPDGFGGATLNWTASCSANRSTTATTTRVGSGVHYRTIITFRVTDPHVRFSRQGELAAGAGGAAGENPAQPRLTGAGVIGNIFDVGTHTVLGSVPSAGSS